ncbi:MAG: hypothetical protein AAFZ89_03275 [Bacteroidota bacterium]
MKTRKNFLDWKDNLSHLDTLEINQSKFYDIQERDYLYKVLDHIVALDNDLEVIIKDYRNLENQRLQIMDNHAPNGALSISRIEKGIQFCSKPDDHKRQAKFTVNPHLSDYLVCSNFLWNNVLASPLQKTKSYYLSIPSFLPLAPKEICLINLNAILLDIKDYREVFSYREFFDLVSEVINLPEKEMDKIFLEYISNQILYYGTIVPVN